MKYRGDKQHENGGGEVGPPRTWSQMSYHLSVMNSQFSTSHEREASIDAITNTLSHRPDVDRFVAADSFLRLYEKNPEKRLRMKLACGMARIGFGHQRVREVLLSELDSPSDDDVARMCLYGIRRSIGLNGTETMMKWEGIRPPNSSSTEIGRSLSQSSRLLNAIKKIALTGSEELSKEALLTLIEAVENTRTWEDKPLLRKEELAVDGDFIAQLQKRRGGEETTELAKNLLVILGVFEEEHTTGWSVEKSWTEENPGKPSITWVESLSVERALVRAPPVRDYLTEMIGEGARIFIICVDTNQLMPLPKEVEQLVDPSLGITHAAFPFPDKAHKLLQRIIEGKVEESRWPYLMDGTVEGTDSVWPEDTSHGESICRLLIRLKESGVNLIFYSPEPEEEGELRMQMASSRINEAARIRSARIAVFANLSESGKQPTELAGEGTGDLNISKYITAETTGGMNPLHHILVLDDCTLGYMHESGANNLWEHMHRWPIKRSGIIPIHKPLSKLQVFTDWVNTFGMQYDSAVIIPTRDPGDHMEEIPTPQYANPRILQEVGV